jgi:hypothetical protein
MTKAEAVDFAARMKGLDSSDLDRWLSTLERRLRQLDQIWLNAETLGILNPKTEDLTVHNLWARLHRGS